MIEPIHLAHALAQLRLNSEEWDAFEQGLIEIRSGGMRGAPDTLVSKVGESPAVLVLDRARLVVAIGAVEEGLAETRRNLPPDKRLELILAAYDLIESDEGLDIERHGSMNKERTT